VGDVAEQTMMGFGYKNAWLAIRDGEPAAAIATLGMRDLGPVGWRDATELAYLTDDRLLVTPPLPGAAGARWVLVAGRGLMYDDASVDVVQLSARLRTEVQAFATHRVTEWHRWQRAVDGVLVRAFEYVGESGAVKDWRGEPDQAERAVGLPSAVDDDTTILVGEHDVMRVAAAWSIDPSALDGQSAAGLPRAVAVR
jgi:hypothetical protein